MLISNCSTNHIEHVQFEYIPLNMFDARNMFNNNFFLQPEHVSETSDKFN
nr:protein [Spodoptera litura nucleopolyhedrovirus]